MTPDIGPGQDAHLEVENVFETWPSSAISWHIGNIILLILNLEPFEPLVYFERHLNSRHRRVAGCEMNQVAI